jgi:hypothetical protein
MRKLLLLILLALPAHVWAQSSAIVLSSCGTASYSGGVGQQASITQDSTGKICTSAAATGGGITAPLITDIQTTASGGSGTAFPSHALISLSSNGLYCVIVEADPLNAAGSVVYFGLTGGSVSTWYPLGPGGQTSICTSTANTNSIGVYNPSTSGLIGHIQGN